jgi:Tol biopolymer transport system component
MALASGTRLGPYELLSPLGAGGMGEVYRARDTRLNREVAVKVLPERFASDGDARSRFQREAQAVAALSHPNILAIHDIGLDGALAYSVTELLDGETLRARLQAGALSQRKAIDYSLQTTSALAAAHERGVIHRDLKPENIFLTRDGRVKILDFGLAKLKPAAGMDAGQTQAPTTPAETDPGTVMGTVGYMSPEQVRGKTADARSDIFSFGAILYEMLSGKRSFKGDTAAETMTAILREEPPDLTQSNPNVTPSLDRIVRHCLEKNPEERFQSARDIGFALQELTGSSSGATAIPSAAASRLRRGSVLALLGAGAGLILGIALTSWLRKPDNTEPVRIHALTFSGRDNEPAASPDGKLVAFTSWRDGMSRIWIKQLAGGGEAPLTAGPDRRARFSPDGSSLLFLRDLGTTHAVYRVGLVGGEPRKLVDDVAEADWSPDGRKIAFFRLREGGRIVSQFGIFDLESGKETILSLGSDLEVYSPRWAPDGGMIAFSGGNINRNSATWRLLQIDAATGKVSGLSSPGNALGGLAWSGNGRDLFYIQSASVMGDISGSGSRVLRLDRRTGRTRPVLWADGLAAINASTGEVSRCDVLSPGVLVFAQRMRQQNLRETVLRTAAGAPPARLITEGSSIDRQPTYSPDGKQILFSSNRNGNLDLWVMDVANGALRQITDDRAQDWDPAFTPDGQHILWDSDRSGHLEVWIANADGSGARQVTQDGVDAENPNATPDGKWIVYWSGSLHKRGVWKIHPDGSGAVRLLDADAVATDVSPDGRYVLYVEQNRNNLRNTIHFLEVDSGKTVPFTIAVPYTLSSSGIIWGRARWSPDGRSIYYIGEDRARLSGVFVQDFAPGRDTTPTRRPVGGFSPEYVTESLGISPIGSRLVISTGEEFVTIMLAENVPGALPQERRLR